MKITNFKKEEGEEVLKNVERIFPFAGQILPKYYGKKRIIGFLKSESCYREEPATIQIEQILGQQQCSNVDK